MPAEQPAHVGTQQTTHAQRLDRFHRRRALLVLEQRQLAEDVARTERCERQRAPTRVGADRPCSPRAHDVARVARVALAKHDLSHVEVTWHGELRDPLQVLAHQRREHRYPPEELDRLR